MFGQLSTTETALTAYLVTSDESVDNSFLQEVQEHLHHHFNIAHAAIQIENKDGDYTCVLDHDECKF